MPEDQWQAFAANAHRHDRRQAAGGSVRLEGRPEDPDLLQHLPAEERQQVLGLRPGRHLRRQGRSTGSKLTNQAFINHDYFDEANQFGKGRTNFFILKLDRRSQAEAVSKTIDAMFENSPDETKTQTEKDFNLGFVKQIGDIGLIVRWILFAVFFTLLLVVGNTMAQSVRERIPELAVLKTLGFSDGAVLGFVLAEAFALCLFGGLLGLALATLAGAAVAKGTGGQFQLSVDGKVWLIGVAAILLMSLAVGLLPALRARRLKIVDALAGR